MKIDPRRYHCQGCRTFAEEMGFLPSKEPMEAGMKRCCKWFMDNVVCGPEKNTEKCTIRNEIQYKLDPDDPEMNQFEGPYTLEEFKKVLNKIEDESQEEASEE